VQGSHADRVLAHRRQAHAEVAQDPVRVAAPHGGLALHQHVGAGVADLVVRIATGQPDVAGQAGRPAAGDERGAPVGGDQRRLHAGRQVLVVGLAQRGAQVRERVLGQLGAVLLRVRHPLLDRLAAGPGELDLEHAQPAVGVGAGPGLEPQPAPLHVRPVGGEVRGVEVDRLVAEGALAVDVEDPQLASELRDHRAEHVGGHEVLAVHPGLQLGELVELAEADRVDERGSGGDGEFRGAPRGPWPRRRRGGRDEGQRGHDRTPLTS